MKDFFTSVWFNIFALFILFLFSAFFSGSETSLFSLNRARIRRLRDYGGPGGKLAARLLQRPGKLLITILLGNLIVNIAISSAFASSFSLWLGAKGAAIAIFASTFLLLIFGEVTPKTLAMIKPEEFARIISYPVYFFAVILNPAIIFLRVVANSLLKILKQKVPDSDALLTREEFRATLHKGKTEGGIEDDEAEIIHAITSFKTTIAKEIMIPRNEMICVEESFSLKRAVKIAKKYQHSQLPIFKNNIDNIDHIINVELLIPWRNSIDFNRKITDFADKQNFNFIYSALLVPELCALDSLLNNLKEKNQTIAILLDEYGGTAGMVAQYDIIDTLLGGFSGVSSANSGIHILPTGEIIASGKVRLAKLNWECGLNLPEELDDTLAGYVMRKLGAIPKPGSFFTDDNCEFYVLKMEGNKVKTVKIKNNILS